jgi:hypothetical protein
MVAVIAMDITVQLLIVRCQVLATIVRVPFIVVQDR